jgi:archaellin
MDNGQVSLTDKQSKHFIWPEEINELKDSCTKISQYHQKHHWKNSQKWQNFKTQVLQDKSGLIKYKQCD